MAPTLVLDLDGTLVDSLPDLLGSANRVLAARGLAPFAAPELAAMIGDGAAALVDRMLAARGVASGADDLRAFLEDYTAHPASESRPFPGAEPALRALQAEGWRLAVCTNKPERPARDLLEALGLLKLLDAVGGGDSFPTRKPDPAHLLMTIAAAGGEPATSVVIGDHRNDVLAAAGAGVPCIFAVWGYGPASMGAAADATATGFDEVPALAARLLRSSAPRTSSRPRTSACGS